MHHLLYHSNCADGFAAVCIARRSLLAKGIPADQINPQPVNYGDADQMPLGKDGFLFPGDFITYLDYTPPQATLDQFYAEHGDKLITLTIIDHHEKAAPLHGYTRNPDQNNVWTRTSTPPFVSIFGFTRSGAGLSFGHHFPQDSTVPHAIALIEHRDLGLAFQHPAHPLSADALNLHAYLFRCLPRTFEAWEHVINSSQDSLQTHECRIGAHLRAADGCIIASAVNACHWLDFSSLGFSALHPSLSALARIPAVNGLDSGMVSDACQELLKSYPTAPFAASWFVNSRTGQVVYSLRSREPGHPDGHVNVSNIAAACAGGGGGHPCAAGFSTLTPIPLAS